MTPHHLHATAAAWSLQAARGRLADLIAHRRPVDLTRDGLRSTTYGTITGSGGHSDPVSATATLAGGNDDDLAHLARSTTNTLTWLADMLHVSRQGDPLDRLMATLPALRPANAANLAKWLSDLDGRVRAAVGLGDDLVHLPGVDCPRCGVRQVHVRTSAPAADRVVVCWAGDGGCVCTGEGCRCGMPGAVEGVAHIWPRHVVLGAVVPA